MKSNDPVVQILSILQEEKTCYEKILSYLKQQEEAIEREDESRLSEIIEEKSVLIDTLHDHDQKIAQAVNTLSDETLDRLAQKGEGIKKELEELLGKILDREKVCEEQLNTRKLDIQNKSKGLKQGKILLKGYETTRRIKPRISKNI